jgi:DNA-binding CsgD family transcriptional regulator
MALDINEGEVAILARMSNGAKRKEIAQDLGIALSTVNNRIYAAQKRVGCRTTEHLLSWFVRESVEKMFQGDDETSADV